MIELFDALLVAHKRPIVHLPLVLEETEDLITHPQTRVFGLFASFISIYLIDLIAHPSADARHVPP